MLFSSVPFLFYFLPCVLLVYFLVPGTLKNGVLLLASLLFYGWGEPRYLLVMLAAIAQGYVFGLLIEKSRARLRHVAGTQWGSKKYMNMKHLEAALDDASIAG